MIEKVIERWHANIARNFDGGLDELLAEDVVFYSPVVFTPQKGREIAKLYLTAAGGTFGAAQENTDADEGSREDSGAGGDFRYTKQVLSGNQAVLEFEATVAGKYINGVDIIECNDEGKVTEFRVMIRPLQAVNMMHQQMAAMLEKLQKA